MWKLILYFLMFVSTRKILWITVVYFCKDWGRVGVESWVWCGVMKIQRVCYVVKEIT